MRPSCSVISGPTSSRSSVPAPGTTPAGGGRPSPRAAAPTTSRSTATSAASALTCASVRTGGTRWRSPRGPTSWSTTSATAAQTGSGWGTSSCAVPIPALVYCAISAFGPADPEGLAGYDFLAQAMGGLMSITGPPEGEPTKVGVALVDVLTGMNAAVGILAALRERERTGGGQTRRGRPALQRAGCHRESGLGLPQHRRDTRHASATVTPASRHTRPSRPPTRPSPWRSATTASSLGSVPCSAASGWRRTSATPPTPPGSPIETSSRRCSPSLPRAGP
jgi:hypothetical protein